MKTIYKYPLETTYRQSVELPEGFEILTIQVQYGKPCIWVLHDRELKNLKPVEIEIFDTGHDVYHIGGKTARRYIGTYQLADGKLIFHTFHRIQ